MAIIEVNGEKVDTKGMSKEEITKLKQQEALRASDYKTDEHQISAGELESRIAGEMKAQGVDYSFEKGITYAMREKLTELAPVNRLTPKKQKPEWLKFVEELTGFFALLLWGGSVLCFIGYALRGEQDNLYLGIVLAAVVFITGVFSYMQDAKSASLMAQFSKLLAQKIHTRTDRSYNAKAGEWFDDAQGVAFDPTFLARGDIVMLKAGDNVPADVRVLEANDFRVDNSPLTGEPDALERTADDCAVDDPKEATNLVFYGTAVKQGKCVGVVTSIGDDTFIGRIARLTESTENEDTPIAKEIHHFVGIVSAVAIVLGITFFIIGLILGTDLITNLVFMIGIIVANVPEGLLATVTVCLTLTSKSMAGKQVLVKNMEGVETLGSTTCICSDKTGTLTQNKMTFAEVLYDGEIKRTDFVEADASADYANVSLDDASFRMFHQAMLLNTTATFLDAHVNGTKSENYEDRLPFYEKKDDASISIVQWGTQGDASESSIIKFAQFMHPDVYPANGRLETAPENILSVHTEDLLAKSRAEFPLEDTIPFNSANKYHLVITKNIGNEEFPFTVWMKGAPERIVARCGGVVHNGEVVPLTEERRDNIIDKQTALMSKGRRVLAFAKCDIPAADVPAVKTRTVKKRVKDASGHEVEADVEEEYYFEMDAGKINFPMGESDASAPTEASKTKLTLLGMAALIDPPRPSVPAAVLSCQQAGIRVVMVTGDHPTTAAAIAKMVNIISHDYKVVGPKKVVEDVDPLSGESQSRVADPLADKKEARAIVIPGSQFDADTSDAKWQYIFSHDEIVFARTSPQQKLQIVQRFQTMESEIVAVTGDGVNDAPALKKADIGVAMGIAGTEVSKTAADMILMDDNFASIVNGVEEGRLIFDNLKKSIAYTLSSNIPEIAPFLIFITVQTPLPLSTVLILCIDLGTDMVPAISMAWENSEADIMRRPARDSKVDRLVTRKLVAFAYLQIGVIQAIAGFYTWFVVMNDYGFPPHILPGLGANDNWGRQVLYCKLEGGLWRNLAGEAYTGTGDASTAIASGYMFWDIDSSGVIDECTFAAKNVKIGGSADTVLTDAATFTDTKDRPVVSKEAIQALHAGGFVEYIPYKAVTSPFWRNDWVAWDVNESGVPGLGVDVTDSLIFGNQVPGVYSVAGETPTGDDAVGSGKAMDLLRASLGNDKIYNAATFTQPAAADADSAYSYTNVEVVNGVRKVYLNVASRMVQKDALHHAQCAYFVSIIVVQWADLMICKTRWLSIYHQGMRNPAMNFGLVFETILGAFICYIPGIGDALGTRNIRALHWTPAMPFSIVIFLYDEVRKYIMRRTSTERAQGKQIIREYGWLARQSYY
jgi:sodium/potassium-transporting ATPase subunit alpha